jgi:hypothetical protein
MAAIFVQARENIRLTHSAQARRLVGSVLIFMGMLKTLSSFLHALIPLAYILKTAIMGDRVKS